VGLGGGVKCSLAPTVKQTGRESGGQLGGNFQILIVSVFNIRKQCLQTASATRGTMSPDSLPGFRQWTPLGALRPQISWATAPSENSWCRRYSTAPFFGSAPGKNKCKMVRVYDHILKIGALLTIFEAT